MYCYFHFTDWETEVHREEVICPSSKGQGSFLPHNGLLQLSEILATSPSLVLMPKGTFSVRLFQHLC